MSNRIVIDCPDQWSDRQVEALAQWVTHGVPKMVGITVTVMARTADGHQEDTFEIQTPQGAEEWFCQCRAANGEAILRPATLGYCRSCRASAPWAYVDPSDFRTWPRGQS